MKFTLACSTWIKDEDEAVLEILRKSDRWLTAPELSAMTGIHPRRVERTIRLMRLSMAQVAMRQKLVRDWLQA